MASGVGRVDVAGIRTVVLASADAGLRQRLRGSLTGLRWQVREANGGAEAMAFLEESRPEAMLVDSWLPDLEVGEFAGHVRRMYPEMELLRLDGTTDGQAGRSPRRNELLHALREAQETSATDTAAWASAPVSVPVYGGAGLPRVRVSETQTADLRQLSPSAVDSAENGLETARRMAPFASSGSRNAEALPELVGTSPVMLELARLIRLVAPRSTTVLIEGGDGNRQGSSSACAPPVEPPSGKALCGAELCRNP